VSAFSDFIRNATPEERARVYAEVMKKVAERQKAVLDAALKQGSSSKTVGQK
jgi:RNase P subunit RPR2